LEIVEESAHSETEKESAHGVGARNLGALATQDSFAPTFLKEKHRMMAIHLDLLATYEGVAQGE
jgi:hypothetical protein